MSSTPDPETAADIAAQAERPAQKTRQWLLENHAATLCTTAAHREVEGFPFGSVVPFALDPHGVPFVLLARIAAHTANLRRDDRGSLFVRQSGVEGDPQAAWRVTLVGRWAQVPADDPDIELLHARYRQRVPRAVDYEATHDFHYWRMSEIRKVRYIAGFGKICWFDGADVQREPGGLGIAEAGPSAVAHMNEDHAHNLIEMCAGLHGIEPEHATMTRIDVDGFYVRTKDPDHTLFFPFASDTRGEDLRFAVIDVLKRARRHRQAAE